MKTSIPYTAKFSLVLIATLCCSGVATSHAGWSLSSSSGPTYYGSPNNTSEYPDAYSGREAAWTAGTLSADASSLDMELQSMVASTICSMGGCNGPADTNYYMTNAWVQAVGTATWTWPGGAPTT